MLIKTASASPFVADITSPLYLSAGRKLFTLFFVVTKSWRAALQVGRGGEVMVKGDPSHPPSTERRKITYRLQPRRRNIHSFPTRKSSSVKEEKVTFTDSGKVSSV